MIKSSFLVSALNLQLYSLHIHDNLILYASVLCSMLICSILSQRRQNSKTTISDSIQIINISNLVWFVFQYDNQNFWLLSTAFLALINHFLIREVANRDFHVPNLELLSVYLISFIIFTINSFI